MKNILIIGAGRSSTSLINYILDAAKKHDWFVTIGDASPELAIKKVNGHPNGRGIWLDATKPNDRKDVITRADLVISLLPAHLHFRVAQDCIKLRKHLVTASYVSRDLYRLSKEVYDLSLIFMGEMGLDPGIDHMSAMKSIHSLRAKGATIKSFKSYAGGLIAPESDDNPWHYKFTWNPRNVILAGQGTAQYIEDGKYKYTPYNRLFKQYKLINIQGMGEYEAYANRDSLLYREVYGLSDIPTIKRCTLRHRGFCDAWNALIQLGLTDDSYPILNSDKLSYRDLLEAYLESHGKRSRKHIKERVASFLGIGPSSEVIERLEWAGLFSNKQINLKEVSPAQILQQLLLEKWKLKPEDKDMIIMQHDFEYELNGKEESLTSTMVMKGENSTVTAMSKLVGLPIGIFVKLIMTGKLKPRGVQIPITPEIYNPILDELEDYGVVFKETHH